MIRASDLHPHTCAACAAVCQACAEDCAEMSDDLRMKALADTCRHCAESCRAMAAGMGRGDVGDGEQSGSGGPRGPRRTGAVLSRRKTE